MCELVNYFKTPPVILDTEPYVIVSNEYLSESHNLNWHSIVG